MPIQYYLQIEVFKEFIFPIIQKYLSKKDDPIPDYESQKEGIDSLMGILERVKSTHYKDIHEKAAYLFVAINKNHNFGNGNKRLALMATVFFYYLNQYFEIDHSKGPHSKMYEDNYSEKLNSILGQEIKDNDPLNDNFHEALYILAIYIADKNLNKSASFDELKYKVEEFFRYCFKKKT